MTDSRVAGWASPSEEAGRRRAAQRAFAIGFLLWAGYISATIVQLITALAVNGFWHRPLLTRVGLGLWIVGGVTLIVLAAVGVYQAESTRWKRRNLLLAAVVLQCVAVGVSPYRSWGLARLDFTFTFGDLHLGLNAVGLAILFLFNRIDWPSQAVR